MFVRVTRLSVTFDSKGPSWEQEVARQAERTIAYLRQQPGFRRYLAGRDSASGHGIVISEWETREQAQQYTPRADLAQEVARLGVRAESTEVYEVASIAELAQVVA